MGANSKIEWTHHTFNPWIGCTKVSPGCAHCYAEAEAKRRGWAVWGDQGTRHVTSDAYWRQPLTWAREAERAGEHRRVFCASLADVLEDRPELEEPRKRLWSLIRLTANWLDWLLLTKRVENAEWMIPGDVLDLIWLGTTIENRTQRLRVGLLQDAGAVVSFLSIEPLLEHLGELDLRGVGWVIVGGESGPDARPCDIHWIRSIIRQCRAADVACLVKQLGAVPQGPEQSVPEWVTQLNRKGGNWECWPEDLRVRELPEVRRV